MKKVVLELGLSDKKNLGREDNRREEWRFKRGKDISGRGLIFLALSSSKLRI